MIDSRGREHHFRRGLARQQASQFEEGRVHGMRRAGLLFDGRRVGVGRFGWDGVRPHGTNLAVTEGLFVPQTPMRREGGFGHATPALCAPGSIAA